MQIQNNKTLHTIFGTAKISDGRYYKITSKKEGNHNKYLHRLIYERFWGVKLPKEIHIHYKDENKLNNCILNLEAIPQSKHKSLHMINNNPFKGKKHTDEICMKLSNLRNTTGYFRVSICKKKGIKQGYLWVYSYYDENNQKHHISSVDLDKLKEKVLAKGLEWRKL